MKNINVNYNRTFNILSQTYKKYKLLKSKMANLLSLLLTNFKTNNYIYGSSFLVYLKKTTTELIIFTTRSLEYIKIIFAGFSFFRTQYLCMGLLNIELNQIL